MTKNNTDLIVTDQNDSTHYPSKQSMSLMVAQMNTQVTQQAIVPNKLARTDGFDVDGMVDMYENMIQDLNPESKEYINKSAMLSRTLSVSDLTEKTYFRFADNLNSMYNWLDQVIESISKTDTVLKSPNTKVWRLPIELAQFIRLEYHTTSQHDKDLFNQLIFDKFELQDGKTYFIKTGTFSSKFQFANAKCYEPREMGEYFTVINNFAMEVGAGQTIDLVVREYIEDVEENPTIYNGMPLRTEFRAFVDCDSEEIIGIVPYWNPLVMKRALKMGISPSMEQDYQTYLKHEHKLMDEYNDYLPTVRKEIKKILPELNLNGQYSIDVMKNGDDLYVIDLALMSESALTELIGKDIT